MDLPLQEWTEGGITDITVCLQMMPTEISWDPFNIRLQTETQ